VSVNFAGLFDVVFECINGDVFVLRIDCRSEPFVVKFHGCNAQHALLDSDMNVRIAYSNVKLLGAAVMETVTLMQLDPPMYPAFTDLELAARQPHVATPVQQIVHRSVQDAATISDLTPSLDFKDQTHGSTIIMVQADLMPAADDDDRMETGTTQSDRMDTGTTHSRLMDTGTTRSDPDGTYYSGDYSFIG
jgi:hypothetical protein